MLIPEKANLAQKIFSPGYYTYFGFRDWRRFPLVYPYSIHTIGTVNYGRLLDEGKVVSLITLNDYDALFWETDKSP